MIYFHKQVFLNLGFNGGEFILLPVFYGLAALSIFSINIKESPQKNSHKNILEEIGEGIDVLKEKPKIRNAITNLVLLYSLLAALYVLSISLASSIESLGPTRFGTLLAISGLGLASGAILLVTRCNRPRSNYM